MGNITSNISNTKAAKHIKQALGDDKLYAFPDEPFYAWDHVRCYNLDLVTTPFCVTYPKTVQQVSAIVKIAAENGLKVQAKSGGHSYCNFSSPDGGVVVDLKHFQGFTIDPQTFVCDVGGGTLLEDLDRKLFTPHKRAIAHGVCQQVGLGGHATIGGLGPSSRRHGTALDHIEAVEIVLASGRIVTASPTSEPDLFWAVRGAAASFGIITSFRLRTEPAPQQTVEYRYAFTTGSWADMAAVFKSWQRFIAAPDLSRDFASEAVINSLGLVVSGTFFGSQADFDKLALRPDFPLAHNTGAATHVFDDWLGSLTHWAEKVALQLGGGIPARAYTKTLTFGGDAANCIPDDVVDKMFRYIERTAKDTLIWFAIFDLAGGAVNDVPMDATAYAHRDALFYLQAYAVSQRGPVSPTTKSFLAGLTQLLVHEMTVDDGKYTDYGEYPGYVDLEIAQPQRAYWRANLGRLESVKEAYDEGDVFRNPQSVRPGGREGRYEVPVWARAGREGLPWWLKFLR